MTITSTTLRNSYTGNGSTTVFAYTFRILTDDEILVTVDGVVKAKTTDYTVSGVGNLNGGNITFVSGAPASAASVIIKANPSFTQEIDYNELDAFPAESHESGLDRGAIRDLSLKEEIDRAVLVPANVALPSNEISGTITADSQVITINTSGLGLGTVAASSALLNFETETFNGTGAQTDFTLTSFTPVNAVSIEVSVGGSLQRPTDDYTVAGAVVTFNSAPASGTDNVLIRNLATGSAATTPADGSITTAKIQDSAVTYAKIQDVANYRVLGNVSGSAAAPAEVTILDEDDFASDSATALITQQSAKAYVDDALNINAYSSVTAATDDEVLVADTSDSGNLKKVTAQSIADLATSATGLDLLATITASNDATADFDSNIDSTYDTYLIVLNNVVPASDAVNMQLRTSTDGGSSYDSGSNNYKFATTSINSSGTDRSAGSSDTKMLLQGSSGDVGSAAGEGASGNIYLYGPSNSALKTCLSWHLTAIDSGGDIAVYTGAGCRDTAADVDAVRIFFSSGNIESGELKLYGLKKTV